MLFLHPLLSTKQFAQSKHYHIITEACALFHELSIYKFYTNHLVGVGEEVRHHYRALCNCRYVNEWQARHGPFRAYNGVAQTQNTKSYHITMRCSGSGGT